MNQVHAKKENLLCGAAFCFFVLVTTYKLTNAPLWFDETIEYWYSRIMVGSLPYESAISGSANMYQRIISTYQPPLYNIIMYFWLKISESEWWFRFFGVVMGFTGMIALYKTIQKIGNGYIAALAVIFSSCVYQLTYYWQECAEYCLMLGTLFWTIYFWICLIEKPDKKGIICFTISAVIPVYSQYGAVFPVAAMAFTALLYLITLKDRQSIKTIIVAYIITLIGAALPLYCFFLKKQMLRQQAGEITYKSILFSVQAVKDFFYDLRTVFKWNFMSYCSDVTVVILLVILMVMILMVVILPCKRVVKLFAATNILTWILYYFSVKAGIYSYGNFGSRYDLFFIPLWIVLNFAIAIEFGSMLTRYISERFGVKALYAGLCCCFILCFSYFGWASKLQNNWNKEDCRGVVNTWYEVDAANSDTIIYYGAVSGFAYYVRQSRQYSDTTENRVNYMDWCRDKNEDEYREYVDSIYGDRWPGEIYVVASHTRDDVNTLVSSIMNEGYEREDVYVNEGAYLIRLTQK